ncbi:hypothetical protein ACHAXM_001775, partial [Skeletonema potamos]
GKDDAAGAKCNGDANDDDDDDDGSIDDKLLKGKDDFVPQGNNDSSVNTSPTRTALTSGEVTRHRFKIAFMAVVRTIHPSTSRKDDPGE